MKGDIFHRGERIGQVPAVLIAEGLLVGVVGGLTVLLYRMAVVYAGERLGRVLIFIKEDPVRTAGWFVVLMMLAVLTGLLMKWEPMIAGGGIPQVKKEINGTLYRNWKRVIPAKFAGGFFCVLGGLSVGRCGPSIQLGAMAGQGVAQILGRGEEEERSLMTCGAGAGLAATFHAPLAGMIFAMEEVNKGGSKPLFVSVLSAAAAADYVCARMAGTSTIFQFELKDALPQVQYWMLLLLGLLLGMTGAFYSWAMQKAQSLYKRFGGLNETGRVMTAFFTAGVFALLMPSVLGSGNGLILALSEGELLFGAAVLAFVMKFLFSGICLGSGAPGGNVFPLLTLGALAGGIFAMAGVEIFGLDAVYINNFVLLAMAGFFSAVMRAPVTGIVLLFEMSGAVNQLLSLSIVSLTAYIAAEWLYPRTVKVICRTPAGRQR